VTFILASDLLTNPHWRPLRCRLEEKDSAIIYVILDGQPTNDFIELFIPGRNRSPSSAIWNHVTDAGCAETGTLKAEGW
jgi:hypothetical protein